MQNPNLSDQEQPNGEFRCTRAILRNELVLHGDTGSDIGMFQHHGLLIALREGLVHRNAAALTDPPKVTHHEISPYTPEQARAFLGAVKGDRLEALFAVAVTLGLRQGEILGLRWADIDLDRGLLSVRFQLQRVDGKLSFVAPKTKRSRRTIKLPAVAVSGLRARLTRQRTAN